MNALARLRARLRRTDIAPIGTRLDLRLGDVHVNGVPRPGTPGFSPSSALVGLDGLADLFAEIRRLLFDETVTAWTPVHLPAVTPDARPVLAEFLRHLETEIPSHKWALLWRLGDLLHYYGFDR